jgi:hypothetical protein
MQAYPCCRKSIGHCVDLEEVEIGSNAIRKIPDSFAKVEKTETTDNTGTTKFRNCRNGSSTCLKKRLSTGGNPLENARQMDIINQGIDGVKEFYEFKKRGAARAASDKLPSQSRWKFHAAIVGDVFACLSKAVPYRGDVLTMGKPMSHIYPVYEVQQFEKARVPWSWYIANERSLYLFSW